MKEPTPHHFRYCPVCDDHTIYLLESIRDPAADESKKPEAKVYIYKCEDCKNESHYLFEDTKQSPPH